MAEDTVIHEMDLPPGKDWAWFPDANIVGLRRGLDPCGRIAALDDLYSHWRRQHLRVVETA